MNIFVVLVWLVAAALPVDELIVRLGSAKYADREQASQQLIALAETNHVIVLNECVRAYKRTDDPEVRYRLRVAMERVVDQSIYRAPRGFLGIRLNNVINAGGKIILNGVTMPAEGIWVGGTIENTAAAQAGLQVNDFIISVDDRPWGGWKATDFTGYIQAKPPGTPVKLTVVRGEATNQLNVVLGDLPREQRDMILTEQGSREFFEKWYRDQFAPPATQNLTNSTPPASLRAR